MHTHTHTNGCSHAHTPQTYTHMQYRLGGESQIVSAWCLVVQRQGVEHGVRTTVLSPWNCKATFTPLKL